MCKVSHSSSNMWSSSASSMLPDSAGAAKIQTAVPNFRNCVNTQAQGGEQEPMWGGELPQTQPQGFINPRRWKILRGLHWKQYILLSPENILLHKQKIKEERRQRPKVMTVSKEIGEITAIKTLGKCTWDYWRKITTQAMKTQTP